MRFLFLASRLRLFINRVACAPKSNEILDFCLSENNHRIMFVQFEVSRGRIRILISLRLDSTRI